MIIASVQQVFDSEKTGKPENISKAVEDWNITLHTDQEREQQEELVILNQPPGQGSVKGKHAGEAA
jgi:hypothetical protein